VDTADRIAFAGLIIALIAAILPLLWGSVQWLISLQSSRAVQDKELESQRGELDLIQKYMAARVRADLQMGIDLADLKRAVRELERRTAILERE